MHEAQLFAGSCADLSRKTKQSRTIEWACPQRCTNVWWAWKVSCMANLISSKPDL